MQSENSPNGPQGRDSQLLNEQIDEICDRFEQAWRAGEPPALNDYLADWHGDARRLLIEELLRVDRAYRQRHGKPASKEIYRDQLPHDTHVVEQAFEESVAEPASDSGPLPPAGPGPWASDSQWPQAAKQPTLPPPTAPAAVTLELAGTRFGDYFVEHELGQGAFGVVYQARQLSTDRLVALKVLRMEVLAAVPKPLQAELLARFRREARAAARLEHDCVVTIYEVGDVAGRPYYAMKRVQGESLDALVAREGVLPNRTAANYLYSAASAIAVAHREGILHRDLKPHNILLESATGRALVADFGLAKLADADPTATQTGIALGTPAYMPPEQAAGAEHVTAASDIYSLGATLYHLLTARPPFTSSNQHQLAKQLREFEPLPPRESNPAVDRDLETICLRCLQKEPQARYRTATELVDDLQRYLRGEPIVARPVGPWERTWRWCRRHPTRAGLLAACAVAALSLVGAGVSQFYQQQLAAANTALSGALEREEQLNSDLEASLDSERNLRLEADQLQRDNERLLSLNRINLSLHEWQKGNYERAGKLLDACPSAHRQWEWHYAHRQCHPERLAVVNSQVLVGCVAYSPDGTRFAVGFLGSPVVKLYVAATGELAGALEGHKADVRAVTFSRDGSRIATASWDGTARLWDAKSHRELKRFVGHTKPLSAVALSPDGTRLATGSMDQTARIWDPASGKSLHSLNGHTHDVASVAFSPDGKRLATASFDKSLKVWDWQAERELHTLAGHEQIVESVSFSPDGTLILSASWDGTAKLWAAQTGRLVRTLETGTRTANAQGIVVSDNFLHRAVFSSDGTRIATGGGTQEPESTNEAIVWNTRTGEREQTFRGHTKWVQSVAFSPDGQQLLTGGWDGKVAVWDCRPAAAQRVLGGPGEMLDFTAATPFPDCRRVASCNFDDIVQVWDLETGGELLALKGHQKLVVDITVSADAARLATASLDGTCRIWDAQSGELLQVLDDKNQEFCAIAFSPTRELVATGGTNGQVRLWNANDGQPLTSFPGHAKRVTAVCFTPDGELLISVSWDETLQIRDVASGSLQATVRADTDLFSCAVSSDGRLVAAGGRTVIVWDLPRQREVVRIDAGDIVHAMSFSSDSARLATSGTGHVVRLWDLPSGRTVLALDGHEDHVDGILFSSDGQQLVSCAQDGKVFLWDARSGRW